MAGLARDCKRRSAGEAVMRAASRGIRPRQGVARFEISDVQTLFWLGNRGCGQRALLPALLDARYGVGSRLFPGGDYCHRVGRIVAGSRNNGPWKSMSHRSIAIEHVRVIQCDPLSFISTVDHVAI